MKNLRSALFATIFALAITPAALAGDIGTPRLGSAGDISTPKLQSVPVQGDIGTPKLDITAEFYLFMLSVIW